MAPPHVLGVADSADRLARFIASRVDHYRKTGRYSEEEAQRAVFGSKQEAAEILKRPPLSVGWPELARVRRHFPEAYDELWRRMVAEADLRIEAGHIGHLQSEDDRPAAKAAFLAMRQRFIDEYQPAGGIGLTLIDTLTATYFRWQEWATLEMKWANVLDAGDWYEEPSSHGMKTYRIDKAEMVEIAARHAERAHRQLTRTLRALQSWRKDAVSVTVNGPANVNLGNQQINSGTD